MNDTTALNRNIVMHAGDQTQKGIQQNQTNPVKSRIPCIVVYFATTFVELKSCNNCMHASPPAGA
jgi:hypothetical protein